MLRIFGLRGWRLRLCASVGSHVGGLLQHSPDWDIFRRNVLHEGTLFADGTVVFGEAAHRTGPRRFDVANDRDGRTRRSPGGTFASQDGASSRSVIVAYISRDVRSIMRSAERPMDATIGSLGVSHSRSWGGPPLLRVVGQGSSPGYEAFRWTPENGWWGAAIYPVGPF